MFVSCLFSMLTLWSLWVLASFWLCSLSSEVIPLHDEANYSTGISTEMSARSSIQIYVLPKDTRTVQ